VLICKLLIADFSTPDRWDQSAISGSDSLKAAFTNQRSAISVS
jgi:hypothetical protein